MLKYKKGWKKFGWREVNRTMVFLVMVAVIMFSCSGVRVSAQGKDNKSVSPSSNQVISLNVNQMELRDVLRLIAEKADLNIVISKEVAGSVTLRLKNVNLWQALKTILEVNGFTYREEQGIVQVVKLEEVAAEKPILVTKVIGLKHAEAEGVKEACKHLLSSSGIMEVDARTNALVITDSSQNIEKIRQLLAKLDTGIPAFNLTGILFAPDHSLAMINNRILKVGETIGDFTISEIGEDSVTLKKGDQVVPLRLREELRVMEK